MKKLAIAAPPALRRIVVRPPSLSVSGPLMMNDTPYTMVPAAKMMPKALLSVFAPSALVSSLTL